MAFFAIVAEQGGRIAKYAPFGSQAEAEAHVAQYGGFVFDNAAGTPVRYINVDWAGQTATAMSQAEIDAEQAAQLDALKDHQATSEVDKVLGDIQRRTLNVMFADINERRVAAGQAAITLQQYVNLLNGPTGDGPISRQQFINYVKSRL